MASVNRVILLGNLGKDPESRYLPNGDAVCNFSIATTEKFKDKSGTQQEHTEWHRISCFGKTAEVAGQYLKKGSPVFIEGRIKTRKWQDKEGQDRYTTEITCDRLQLLGGKPDGQSTDTKPDKPAPNYNPPNPSGFDAMDDDIPF